LALLDDVDALSACRADAQRNAGRYVGMGSDAFGSRRSTGGGGSGGGGGGNVSYASSRRVSAPGAPAAAASSSSSPPAERTPPARIRPFSLSGGASGGSFGAARSLNEVLSVRGGGAEAAPRRDAGALEDYRAEAAAVRAANPWRSPYKPPQQQARLLHIFCDALVLLIIARISHLLATYLTRACTALWSQEVAEPPGAAAPPPPAQPRRGFVGAAVPTLAPPPRAPYPLSSSLVGAAGALKKAPEAKPPSGDPLDFENLFSGTKGARLRLDLHACARNVVAMPFSSLFHCAVPYTLTGIEFSLGHPSHALLCCSGRTQT
jgi:hypothetical protein